MTEGNQKNTLPSKPSTVHSGKQMSKLLDTFLRDYGAYGRWLYHTVAADLSAATSTMPTSPDTTSWSSSLHSAADPVTMEADCSGVSSLSCTRGWVWDDQSFVTSSIIEPEEGNDKIQKYKSAVALTRMEKARKISLTAVWRAATIQLLSTSLKIHLISSLTTLFKN